MINVTPPPNKPKWKELRTNVLSVGSVGGIVPVESGEVVGDSTCVEAGYCEVVGDVGDSTCVEAGYCDVVCSFVGLIDVCVGSGVVAIIETLGTGVGSSSKSCFVVAVVSMFELGTGEGACCKQRTAATVAASHVP